MAIQPADVPSKYINTTSWRAFKIYQYNQLTCLQNVSIQPADVPSKISIQPADVPPTSILICLINESSDPTVHQKTWNKWFCRPHNEFLFCGTMKLGKLLIFPTIIFLLDNRGEPVASNPDLASLACWCEWRASVACCESLWGHLIGDAPGVASIWQHTGHELPTWIAASSRAGHWTPSVPATDEACSQRIRWGSLRSV